MGELENRLEQSKQEKAVHSQEVTQLRTEIAELIVKWVELQDDVTTTAKRESPSMEQINNLKKTCVPKSKKLPRPRLREQG